jgi:hypothetical protein
VGRFWRNWRVEIIIALLVLLAIFLLAERMNIRQTLYTGVVNTLAGLNRLIDSLVQGLSGFVLGTTLSDLIAYLLLALVAALAIWRTRTRLLSEPRFTTIKCPHCGSGLHRIHRRSRDRLINLIVPVRRYQCQNRDCHWKGLRVYQGRRS